MQFLSLPGHMKILPSSPEVGRDHVTNSNQLAESRNDVCTCVRAKSFQLCPTLCDPVDCSLPGSSLSMEFSRQEYWSGLPCPPPGDLSDPGIHRQFSLLCPYVPGNVSIPAGWRWTASSGGSEVSCPQSTQANSKRVLKPLRFWWLLLPQYQLVIPQLRQNSNPIQTDHFSHT